MLPRIAEADGFCPVFGLARREALWSVRVCATRGKVFPLAGTALPAHPLRAVEVPRNAPLRVRVRAGFAVTGRGLEKGSPAPVAEIIPMKRLKPGCSATGPACQTMTMQEQAIIHEAREILSRYFNRNPVLTSWQAVLDYCALAVRGEEERLHALFLDRKNRLISDEQMAVGTVDHVPVYPREIVKRALLLDASALILVHNHPAGDPDPSEADISMTRTVQKACNALGLTLHDHIIVGAGREASLRALGKI